MTGEAHIGEATHGDQASFGVPERLMVSGVLVTSRARLVTLYR